MLYTNAWFFFPSSWVETHACSVNLQLLGTYMLSTACSKAEEYWYILEKKNTFWTL